MHHKKCIRDVAHSLKYLTKVQIRTFRHAFHEGAFKLRMFGAYMFRSGKDVYMHGVLIMLLITSVHFVLVRACLRTLWFLS